MVLNIVGVIILVLAVAVIVNTIEDIRRKNKSKISFKESIDLTELPVVTFYNGDKKINFLLDTGSNISYINKSVVSSFTVTPVQGSSTFIGVEGNKNETSLCSMTLKYRDNIFEEVFSLADMDKAFDSVKKESGVTIHGILGSKFFEKYRYVLDFKELIAYIRK